MENHTSNTIAKTNPETTNAIIQSTKKFTYKPISLKPDPTTTENLSKHTLIGKIISAKDVNYNKVIAIIQKAWKNNHGLSIASLGQNTFLFKFTSENDMQHTISSGPWNIDGKHLILKHWIPGTLPHDLDFSTTSFWIQVHNLPIDYMTEENAKRISAHVGNLLKIDINETGTITVGKYLRMKVEIEAYAPLKCGFLMDQSPHPDAWFEFKYERLSDFCFHCGRLGHLKIDCNFDPPSDLALKWDIGPKGYGPWIQANPTEQKSSRLTEIIARPKSASQDYEYRARQSPSQTTHSHHNPVMDLPSSSQNPSPNTQSTNHHETPSPPQNLATTQTQITNTNQNTTPQTTNNPQPTIQNRLYLQSPSPFQAGIPSLQQNKFSTGEPCRGPPQSFPTPISSPSQSHRQQNPRTTTTDYHNSISGGGPKSSSTRTSTPPYSLPQTHRQQNPNTVTSGHHGLISGGEPKESITPISTPKSQSPTKKNPLFFPKTATTEHLGMTSDLPIQADPHVTLDLGNLTTCSDTSFSTSQLTHNLQQSNNPLPIPVSSQPPHLTHTQTEPSPHHALISQPTPNTDPNSILTEAFLLFKVSSAFLNKPSGSFIGPNHLSGPSTCSGPSSCSIELIENGPTSLPFLDKPITQTNSTQKRKSISPTLTQTKKIKLSPLISNTKPTPPKHLRATVSPKKPRLKSLARNRIPTSPVESYSSPMLTNIPINPNSMTEEAGHPMPPTPQC
jgi:hypothetical protein